MHRFLKPLLAIPLAMITSFGLPGPVSAQPSADSIINSLKPTDSTRGIKLGGGPSAGAAPASRPASGSSAAVPRAQATHAAAAVAPAGQAAGPSVNLTVNFPTGSADLTPAAKASLDALGKALSSADLATFRFRIEGHTDTVGSREENKTLSQKRAEAVVAYLTSQYHVAPDRLQAVGMGEEQLLVPTPPQTPEARNRRVQVINIGA